MARKPILPEVRPTNSYDYLFNKAVKETLQQMTGVIGGPLTPLAPTASNAEIVAKINQIIDRLNID